ncbi:MAG: TetR/AcrR family transcriptional regulator [Coriobacteriales bacterium]|jgi:AcrR family transcriptional regulator|nr:TetR/AcrR family transcriptional regulator [Coriobacteriales bacterium]
MPQTVDAIKASFRELLKTTTFDKISISDICKRAEVSRKSFYKHFASKEDIIEAQIHEDMVQPTKDLRKLLPLEQIKSSPLLATEQFHVRIYNNRDFYQNLLEHFGKAPLVEIITRQITNLNQEIFSTYGFEEDELRFMCHYLGAVQAMMISWWLEGNLDIEAKQFAGLMNDWSFARFRELDREHNAW